jgi:bacterioferritin
MPILLAQITMSRSSFLDNENETIHHYRQRVRQCEALGEYALAEHIRDILVQEQDHQIALANALGVEIPNVDRTGER